jgi:hypothetical protein
MAAIARNAADWLALRQRLDTGMAEDEEPELGAGLPINRVSRRLDPPASSNPESFGRRQNSQSEPQPINSLAGERSGVGNIDANDPTR